MLTLFIKGLSFLEIILGLLTSKFAKCSTKTEKSYKTKTLVNDNKSGKLNIYLTFL